MPHTPLDPQRYTKVFGNTFVKDYHETALLVIGKDAWTRGELAQLGIIQTRACAILSSIAKRTGAKSLAQFYKEESIHSLAEYPMGVTTLFVLFAIFQDKDLDPETWYLKGKHAAMITFISLKHRELKARERERTDERKRTRRVRRDKHEAVVKQILNT